MPSWLAASLDPGARSVAAVERHSKADERLPRRIGGLTVKEPDLGVIQFARWEPFDLLVSQASIATSDENCRHGWTPDRFSASKDFPKCAQKRLKFTSAGRS